MVSPKRHIDESGPVRPFLKWAGNKYRILDRIKRHLPDGNRLIEPFAGSGALFLNTDYKKNLLTDSNADLIELYNILKQEGESFINLARRYFIADNNRAERYYELRDRFNACSDPHQRAALFIYLNRHGYNGLCRYNKKGGYNVPFGRYMRPYFPERELLQFSHKARHAEFRRQSFEQTLKQARPGDVVYCDPPYVPLSSSANFTSYSADSFDLQLQSRLAELAQQTADRGIPVLISNHRTPFTREIYKTSEQEHFSVRRFISCNGKKRTMAGEMLALFT
jgi:DNA adenine methylase